MSRRKKSTYKEPDLRFAPTDVVTAPSRRFSRGMLMAVLLALVVLSVVARFSIGGRGAPTISTTTATESLPRTVAYVGSVTCISCHAEQGRAWQGSQHAIALQAATPNSVLGKFDGAIYRIGRSTTRFTQRDGTFTAHTEGADGKLIDAPISHVIGVAPVQQYLVSLPDGRKQSLGLSWDSRSKTAGGQRWIHLFAKEGTRPGHPLHWSGIDQNWNYQCADCHSTNLRKNYDAASDRFNTTWSEISVGCEACHGPGQQHVAWANASPRAAQGNHGLTAALDERNKINWLPADMGTATRSSPRSSAREIEVCARCHARRGQFGDDHRAGDPLLDHFRPALIEPGLYYPDGQQRDEVYNYASFLQSRMYAVGVTCADCHEPHSGILRAKGNAVCTQCHESARFDVSTHHHHPANSPSTACIACHAPTTTYMGVDARHDHSFRIPRPDRSVTLGVPNACTSCHADKSPVWASSAIRSWYPSPKPGFQDFAELFVDIENEAPGASDGAVRLLATPTTPAIVRASALSAVARHLSLLDPALFNASFNALGDSDPLVRTAAIRVASLAPPTTKAYHLAPLLNDPLRLVRMDAARALVGPAQAELKADAKIAFESAISQFIDAQNFNADRPEALTNLGALYLELALTEDALQAFTRATKRDRGFPGGWIGLAQVLEARGDVVSALETLTNGRRHAADSAELAYAQGLLLIRQRRPNEALAALKAAQQLAPGNARFLYVYAVALNDFGWNDLAKKALRTLLAKHPNHLQAKQALAEFGKVNGE